MNKDNCLDRNMTCACQNDTNHTNSFSMPINNNINSNNNNRYAFGVVAEWSKVLTAVPWPLMVWSILALGTYQLRFVSRVFRVIFSFVLFISLYTLGGLRAFRKPLPYNMYLFNLRIANHILIKIKNTQIVVLRVT